MRKIFLRTFQLIAAPYAVCVLAWAITHFILGDAAWWLFIINAFSAYLFLPTPLFLLMALVTRRKLLSIGLGLVLLAGLIGQGNALLPKFSAAPANAPRLRVMTFNMLFISRSAAKTLAAIRAADADVIAIQELNPLIAQALQTELLREYPYQILAPSWQPNGLGTISRFPLTLTQQTLDADGFNGQPQIMALDFRGQPITVINVHPSASTIEAGASMMMRGIRARTAQIKAIARFAQSQPNPLIVLTDMNATPCNDGYSDMAAVLTDAWREAGWGLGHTFPNEITRRTRRFGGGWQITLRWLIRIDYVWHSRHFAAVDVATGLEDGQSDHRPLVATLALVL